MNESAKHLVVDEERQESREHSRTGTGMNC